GVSVVDGAERSFQPGHVVAVPQGTRHNVVNTGPVPLRLVTVYGPPNHPPGTVHHTKSAADRDESDVPPEM
ncbi:MAG TPA: cupin domain-containing protein, partial [Micromonosporaceae bacterium]